MKCPHCGKEIANDSVFCEYCGEQIKKNNRVKNPWRLIAIMLMALVVGGLVYVLSHQSHETGSTNEVNDTIAYTNDQSVEQTPIEDKDSMVTVPAAKKVEKAEMTPMPQSTQQGPSQSQGYVDLGLPSGTLWRSYNEGGGDYGDGLYTYDQAKSKFGNKLPTKSQLEELCYNCQWHWNGNEYVVTGPNGQSITMPLTGYRENSGNLKNSGITANYWSRNIRKEASYKSWKLYFRSDHREICSWPRKDYHAVRLIR